MGLPFAPLLDEASGVTGVVAALKQSAALIALLVILALALLIKAGEPLRRVRSALAENVTTALAVGVAVQLAWLPALLLASAALALTLLGILLVPFLAVGWIALTIGLVVLGLAGVAEMIGAALGRRGRRGLSERGARLQALVTGLMLLAAPWLLAALLHDVPLAAGIVRALGVGLLWVAMTAGLGAVVRTRAGTRHHDEPWGIKRATPSGVAVAPPSSPSDWVTPTPITGVVAAKRPALAGRDR
ncbi:MAG: hypothetical protein MUF40_03795 [Gemmatimonadaceae bacterium]|nr:hypothetical protein [Gemmatimonadaceae bacterium]